MFKFIVQEGDAASKHFSKYNFRSEVEKCMFGSSNYASSNAFNSGMSSVYREDEPSRKSQKAVSHVYRIKDLTDAINTSVIMDGKKKEQYISMLSNSDSEFNSDNEFVEICHNLGECDIY